MSSHVRVVTGAVALLLSVGLSEARAQYNPNGWIQTGGWNLLFPLLNPDGCAGGGAAKMAGNWIAPHEIGLEDPKAGDEWDDIAFGGAALSPGWGAAALNPVPIWVSEQFLEGAFPGLDIPSGDVVDYQAMVDVLNAATGAGIPGDNVVGIATTYVENLTGAPLAVQICTASDDSVQAWVNNVMVTNVSSCRGTADDCAERNPAVLVPGMNKIATLTWEGGGGWGFRLAIEVGGAKQNDASSLVRFVGPGTNQTGQVVYGATRSILSDPFICDQSAVTVQIRGNAAFDGSAPVTIVETLSHATGEPLVVSNVTGGGVLEELYVNSPLQPVGLLSDHRVVGTAPCGGGSTTTFTDGGTPADPTDDEYTSVSQTGRDIWDAGDANNDSFEFAYVRASGDFDVAIMITGKENTTATRWGKWGLMARWDYDRASRYTIIQDHSNDPQDPCRLAGRTVHRSTGNMYEDVRPDGAPDHPNFLRLTRTGNVVRGYISDDPSSLGWTQVGRDDDWGPGMPAEVLLGFANSQHNSGGCGVQTVRFKIVGATVNPVPITPVSKGKKITWNTTAGAADAGVSYDVEATTVATASASIYGEVVGESAIVGPPSVTLVQIPRTGPIGIFDDSHDIGTPPTRGLTTYDPATGIYTVFGSGGDIWDGGDDFQFAYKHVEGDFVATARVVARGINRPGYRWGRHGLMARASCRRDAKFTMLEQMFQTSAGEVDWMRHHFRMYDQNAGNNRDYLQWNDGVFLNEGQFPQWMRIVRRANGIYSYLSEDANGDGVPDKWMPFAADAWTGAPSELLVGLAVQGRQEEGQAAAFDKVSIVPLPGCYDFEPLVYETGATNTAGIGSRPYTPIQVKARVPANLADAVAQGGSGLGVKNRNWIWTDLTAGSIDLTGTTQLLWNNENRNFANAKIRYVFRSAAKVYIAWDNRHVKGGSDNPDGTVNNGWFDFNNDKGTVNAQGWLRITDRSADGAQLEEEIRTDGDAAFARGGVWMKEVRAGDVLDFLATGFTAGRSPYVVFVDCLEQVSIPGAELAVLDYDGPDDLGVVVVRSGAFTPQVTGGRLRMTSDAVGSSATAVWYGVPANPAGGGVPLLKDGFVAEFDAYLSHSGQANPDFNPADGVGFVVVATGANDGLMSAVAPWPPGLDVASLCGDGGGSLGYHGGTMMERTETHPNFMIEMDTWYGSADAVNEPYGYGSTDFDGKYHFGLNVAGQANSVQTCADLGIPAAALPNLFNPAGVHVEVMYQPTGQIDVWASGVDYNGSPVARMKVLSKAIQPLTVGDVVLGFVGATGGAVETAEIDNFSVSTICTEQPDAVKLTGPASFRQRSSATYTAEFTGTAETGSTVAYSWSIVSGNGTLSATEGPTVELSADLPGEIVLKVEANDGVCDGASAELKVTVIPLTCDLAIDATLNEAAGTVTIAVTSTAPEGCACDSVVLKQNDVEVYAGTLQGLQGREFPVPPECGEPDKLVYTLTCAGPLGPGASGADEITCPVRTKPFIRGDCNQDGEVCRQVSDLVTIIMYCFLGELQPLCPAACDANGDGQVCGSLSDVLYLANFCFTGLNDAPPPPYPTCGRDTATPLACDGPTYCAP